MANVIIYNKDKDCLIIAWIGFHYAYFDIGRTIPTAKFEKVDGINAFYISKERYKEVLDFKDMFGFEFYKDHKKRFDELIAREKRQGNNQERKELSFSTKLYSHQKEAVKKLDHLPIGALHMDMGTGKTRTVLELIKNKCDSNLIDEIIWFCPCSAKENIKKELDKHIVHGKKLFEIVGIESLSSSTKLYSRLLKKVSSRTLLVVDESTKIKNHQAICTQRITELGAMTEYKYILSGNMVPRDELDLYAQYYFLDWKIFGYRSAWAFYINHAVYHQEYSNRIVDVKNAEYLVSRIEPYTYQVRIDECIDLPDKVYATRYFDMTTPQKRMYDEFARYLLSELDERNERTIYRLFTVLHGITSGFTYEREGREIKNTGFESSPKKNPRLELFCNLIETIKGKVIIFCEYQEEVRAINKLLNDTYGKGTSVTYYGQDVQKVRDKHIEAFRETARFLVASKDCASHSLNLQFCNQVIYYNNDWDFGTKEQSERRIYRIGQTKKSYYIDMYCDDSIEKYIELCLKRKENLAKIFIEDLRKKQKEKKNENLPRH